MPITYKETLKINIDNIPLVEDQLTYCTDNGESFFDVSVTKRISTGELTYLNTEADRVNMISPSNGLYFVKATDLLYKYSSGWILISSNYESTFTTNTALNTLVPCVLKRNGTKLAPKTFTSLIYTSDGSPLDQYLNKLTSNESEETDVDVIATTDKQNTFTIPYPFTPYDLVKNIMAIVYNNTIIDPSTYTLSSDASKIILGIDIPLNDKITFAFIYCKSDADPNANSINNIRIFTKRPNLPRLFDVVVDLYKRKIEQYDGQNWRDIGSAHSLIIKSNIFEITANTNQLTIGINGFDKSQDSLIVFQNTTFIAENNIYTVSDDSKTITKIDGEWEANPIDTVLFSILCFKNVPTINGKINGVDIIDGSIQEVSLSQGILDKLNRQYVVQSTLDTAISNLIGTAPTALNNIQKLALAINNDPNYAADVNNSLISINDKLATLLDVINNKLTVVVNTIDGKNVDGQVITIKNNNTNASDDYVLINGNHSVTVDVSKNTSYTASVNLKTGYLTPAPITENSGHLGDETTIAIMYHL